MMKANWETKSIEEVTARLIDYRGKTPPKTDSGVRLITAKVVKGGRIIEEKPEFIAAEFYDAWMRRGLPKQWDLLITTEAPLGEVALLRAPERIALAQRIILLRGNPDIIDQRYYFYALQSEFTQGELNGRGTGTTVLGIKQSELRKVRLQLPDLPTQRKIAGILSAYDDLIENNLRRIKILEEMAQSLYREWFVHFRFPGHESVRCVDSDLGQIPKGWEVRTIEELVKRISVGKKYDQKTANPTGTVPIFDQGKTGVIGYHDDQPGVEASETDPVIVFANHTCYQRLIHYPFSAIQNVLPFHPSPLLPRNIYWLHYAMNGRLVLNDYKGHWPEFAALLVIVPPAEVCQRFGAFVAPLSLEILKLEQAVELLRRTRDMLLPKLLSSNSSDV